MFTVTLEQLRTHGACYDGYNKVVRMLQQQPFTEEDEDREYYIQFDSGEQISLIDICCNNSITEALWATKCLDSTHVRDLRLYAVWCVRRIQHLLTDERSIHALDIEEQFANGKRIEEELKEARFGTWHAYIDKKLKSTHHDTYAPHAAYYTTWADQYIADATSWAARYAALAVGDTKRTEQTAMFIRTCEGKAPWQVDQ